VDGPHTDDGFVAAIGQAEGLALFVALPDYLGRLARVGVLELVRDKRAPGLDVLRVHPDVLLALR